MLVVEVVQPKLQVLKVLEEMVVVELRLNQVQLQVEQQTLVVVEVQLIQALLVLVEVVLLF
jgi:hypothetical protein